MTDRDGANDSATPRQPKKPTWISRSIGGIEGYRKKRRTEKYHESAADWASRSTARATWMIAALTATTIGVGVSQYIIFSRQLTAMEYDQRPWIGLGFAGYPPDSPFQIQFVNGGKSPAFNVSIKANVWAHNDSAEPIVPHAKCTLDCRVSGIEMLPSVPYQFILLRLPSGADIPGAIVARVDYTDSEGRPHKTGICLYHFPDRHDLIACNTPDSNYAD